MEGNEFHGSAGGSESEDFFDIWASRSGNDFAARANENENGRDFVARANKSRRDCVARANGNGSDFAAWVSESDFVPRVRESDFVAWTSGGSSGFAAWTSKNGDDTVVWVNESENDFAPWASGSGDVAQTSKNTIAAYVYAEMVQAVDACVAGLLLSAADSLSLERILPMTEVVLHSYKLEKREK